MSTTRSLDRPGALVAVAAGVVLVVYGGCLKVRRLRRSRRVPNRIVTKGERVLRTLIRQIGVRLQEQAITDEDELDAAVAEVKRKAYELRYLSAEHPGD